MSINGPNIRWPRVLAGRLILRACRSGNLKPAHPGCDCGPARRCPFQTYCMAAKMELTTGARLEKWFWRVIVGTTLSLAFYGLLTWR